MSGAFHNAQGLVFLFLASLILHTHANAPHCWTPRPDLDPLTFRDCNSVITQDIPFTFPLPGRGDPTKPFNLEHPLTFSAISSLDPDVQLPHVWLRPGNPCIVGIDIPGKFGGSDRTSLKDVTDAAKATAVECVIRGEHHLGGIITVGWKRHLNVVVTSIDEKERLGRLGRGIFNETIDTS